MAQTKIKYANVNAGNYLLVHEHIINHTESYAVTDEDISLEFSIENGVVLNRKFGITHSGLSSDENGQRPVFKHF